MRRYVLLLLATTAAMAQIDPREIVRKSIELNEHDTRLADKYMFTQRIVTHELDGKGGVKSTRSETREVFYIAGRPCRRLIEKDGQPLSREEQLKERERVDRVVAERQQGGDASQDRRARERERLRAIPEAFDFTLLREEKLGPRDVWLIEAKPHPGYRGKDHEFLSKMQDRLWIDKQDYHWVKIEAETLDTISFGLFLARIAKGSHLEFEETRVNDEIWLPVRVAVTASARLALVKKFNADRVITFSDYRKFQTDSKIVSSEAIETK